MKRIAISTDGDQVSPHFGRCSSYTIIEIENGQLLTQKVIDNPGHEPGFLPQFLSEKGVNAIVAGGMGPRAQNLFQQVGIETILGVEGPIKTVIETFLTGTLAGGESTCTHQGGQEKSCDYSHH